MSDLQLFWMESALSQTARDWHGGYRGLVADGVWELTEGDLRALHVLPDMRLSIMDAYFKIMSAYTRLDSYHRPGPNLGSAQKYMDWPKLTTLSVDAFVEFYGRSTGDCASFDIGITPFVGIGLRFGHDGLCLPSLGVTIAYEHARALWSLLAKLLPEKAVIQAQINLTQQEQHGYKLLWQGGSVYLDIIDLVWAVKEPCWNDDDNIFSFATRTKTYRHLRCFQGQPLTARQVSEFYLMGIQGTHTHLAQAMLLHLPDVSGCWHSADGDDEILPPEWSLDALANKLHVSVKGGGIPDDMRLGRQPASRVYALEAAYLVMDNHGHLQGYLAICQRAMIPGRPRRPPNHKRPPAPNPERSACHRNQRTSFNGTCSACGCFGHKAVQCDHLAMFVFLSRYVKTIDAESVKAIEERWVEKNRKWLGPDTKPPSSVAIVYLGTSGLTVNQVDAELDWEFFQDSKDTDLADE